MLGNVTADAEYMQENPVKMVLDDAQITEIAKRTAALVNVTGGDGADSEAVANAVVEAIKGLTYVTTVS
jgi:hypothetical protein